MSSLKAPPDWDLPTLNTYIAQQENFRRGPLVAIRGDGEITLLEIDDRAFDKPAANAVITDGRPPPGSTIIGNARIFVRGVPVEVTAYRPVVLEKRGA
jgi:hypothetical protein